MRLGQGLSGYIQWPITLKGATLLIVFLLLGYVLMFVAYVVIRRVTRKLDLSTYKRLTGGQNPNVSWPSSDAPD